MMEGDYDLPSLHCYTMNPTSSDNMVTSQPPTAPPPPPPQQQQQQQQQQAPPTPLKRTRAKRSCDFCRQRKSRCDADTCSPCTNCKAWGYTCEFQTVRKKRGPPSVYVDNLEKRCKKMEQLLMQLTNTTIKDLEQNDFRTTAIKATHRRAISDPSIVSDSSSSDDDDDDDQVYSPSVQQLHDTLMTPCSSSTTSPPPPPSSNDNDMMHRLEKLDIQDYDSIKYTGQSAGLLNQTLLFNNKSKSSFIAWPGRKDTVLQMMADDQLMVVRTEKSPTTGKLDTHLDVGISITSSSATTTTITTTTTTTNKPSKSLVTQMIHLYFSHLHPMFPIINKHRFLHLYESHSPHLAKILLQAILAFTFRFASQQQSGLDQYADMYFNKVMKKLQPQRSTLTHVQAGLLMTLYLDFLSSGNVESIQWQLLGQAIRMAQDLGLHRTCEHWALPPSEIETRHRVFYACYILDRWIGARAGKPLTILDRDFDTTMPSIYEVLDTTPTEQQPPVYRAFYLWIKLSEILGRVLKALYAPSAKLANSNANLDDPMILVVFDRRLKHWYALLDDEASPLLMAQKVNLEIYYNTVILLLRRPFLSMETQPSLMTESRHIGLQAALMIFQLVQQQQQQPSTSDIMGGAYHLLPTCYVYAMFLSSLVHVALVLQDPTSIKNRRALTCSMGLMESHQHLYASQRALEILNMLITLHEINPPTSPNQVKLEQTHDDDDTTYMINQYNTTPDDDGLLTPYRNRTDPLAFHHHPPQQQHHLITSSTCTAASTTIETEMPKSHWFQRFVNTSVVGGVPSEIQHDVATDLSPTSYMIAPPPPPPPTTTSPPTHLVTQTTPHQPSMFYTPYMPSPPMPSSASPSTSHIYPQHHHHLPLLSTSSPEQQQHHHHHHQHLLSTASPEEQHLPSSSSSPPHPLFTTTTTTTVQHRPCQTMMPLQQQQPTHLNWHDWQFYMHPSSPLSK